MPGELELQTDLDANALRYFVRNGSGAMPMFRKAELSDAEVDAIAGYIRASADRAVIHAQAGLHRYPHD